MKATLTCVCLLLAALAWAGDGERKFVPLFNGKDLDGWTLHDDQKKGENPWSVENGVLKAKPASTWLSTKQMYGDYVLKLEWRVPANGNSGVFLRVPDLKPGEQPYTA